MTSIAWLRRRSTSDGVCGRKRAIRQTTLLVPISSAATIAERRGEIGFISSVTRAFCRDCNRARLSTEGKLYLCLFAGQGHDVRELLRHGATDDELAHAIAHVWQQRSDRYSELRGQQVPGQLSPRRVEMSYIGG